jgi:hypothetical protein
MELQTIPMFIEYSMGVHNKLISHQSPSGISFTVPDNPTKPANMPPCSMWKTDFMDGFPTWNAQYKETPRKTLFTILGSTTNAKHMVNTESKLNGLKAKVSDLLFRANSLCACV